MRNRENKQNDILIYTNQNTNKLMKRWRLVEWMTICYLQEIYFKFYSIVGWKYNIRIEEDIPFKHNKAGVVILISDKVDIRVKKITNDKEKHYITIEGSMHWKI